MPARIVFDQSVVLSAQQGIARAQRRLSLVARVVNRLPRHAALGGRVRTSHSSMVIRSIPFGGQFTTVAESYVTYGQALEKLSIRVGFLSSQLEQAMDLLSRCEQSIASVGFDTLQDAQDIFSPPTPIDSYDHGDPQIYQEGTALLMLDLSRIAYTCKDDPNWKAKVKAMGFIDAVYVDSPPGIVAWRIARDGTPIITIGLTGSRKGWDGVYDWTMNAHGLGNKEGIHIGFNAMAKRFIKKMTNIRLEGLQGSPRLSHLIERARQGEKVSFLITGHSKGGGEAQVIAYKLMQQGISSDKVAAYTFGAPKPFLAYRGNRIIKQQANVYNIVNPHDPVTRVGTLPATQNVVIPTILELAPFPNERLGKDIVLHNASADQPHKLNTYEAAMNKVESASGGGFGGGGSGGARF